MSSKVFTALGLMSGTSLDGIDAAIIKTDGEKILEFGPTKNFVYDLLQKRKLEKATRTALRWKFNGKRPGRLETAEKFVDEMHIYACKSLIAENQCDLIGYHGQTVVHKPPQKGELGQTLQLGRGQVLADALNLPCVYDFRTNDMSHGGQGAPLAPIYHKALCEYSKLSGKIVVLNLGGVGNFTLIDGERIAASDTGPANGPLDNWLYRFGIDYDKDGDVSANGKFDLALIEKWLREIPFFKEEGTKSADRYDFDVIGDIMQKTAEDGAATLAAFCAASVKHTLAKIEIRPERIIVCGGGRKNKTILKLLGELIKCPIETAEDVGWMGDDIEAQACAYFAVRSNLGLPLSYPETTGVPKPMTGGVMAFPHTENKAEPHDSA